MIFKHFLLLIIFKIALGFKKNYSEYTLFRSLPSSKNHLEYLKKFQSEDQVDYWKWPGLVNMTVDLLIGPATKEKFIRTMEENNYPYKTLIENIQSAMDNQTVKSYIRRQMASFNWKDYYRVDDIYNWIFDLSRKYPKEVEVIELGTTYEERKIIAVKVLLKGATVRSTVIVEGGIHAREWISPAFVTYFLNQIIVSGKSNNEKDVWKNIALSYEWYFVPVINPDGYEYTHSTDRNWRKNRFGGFGVDINRNFDVAFGTEGIERLNQGSQIYCGEKAFSEKESSALADLVREKKDTLEYYISFHSYGQYMIIPYAHSKKHLENYYEVEDILHTAAEKVAARYGTLYEVGTAYDTIGYTTSGVSGCWVKEAFKTRYVVTFELRDDDKSSQSYGFTLPPELILPTCYETMDGLQHILKAHTKTFEPYLVLVDRQNILYLDYLTVVSSVSLLYYMVF